MTPNIFAHASALINNQHFYDPNLEELTDGNQPAELLYAQRMTEHLLQYTPGASETLKLAALCHHIRRWEVARTLYPMDKSGYFLWRKHVMRHQLSITSKVLAEAGVSSVELEAVKSFVQKDNRKNIPEAQIIEDVACIVFVTYYLEPFAHKHEKTKVVDIIRKTMEKVSQRGQQYIVTKLPVSDSIRDLLQMAS